MIYHLQPHTPDWRDLNLLEGKRQGKEGGEEEQVWDKVMRDYYKLSFIMVFNSTLLVFMSRDGEHIFIF